MQYFLDPVLRGPTIGSMLMCLGAAIIGVIVFLRKESLLGESLSHASYPGVAAGAVIASLILATRRSGAGLSTSLNQLADNIQDRLRALREVERERDLPRSRVQQITVIACLMVAAAAFLGDYLRPYGSPTGQLILTVLVAAFVGCLWQMHRMTVPRRRQRILTTTNSSSSGGGRS